MGFMDYLDKYEKKMEDFSKPKEKLVVEKVIPSKVAVKSKLPARNTTTPIVEADKKVGGSSFSVCTNCGTKHTLINEDHKFCPSCGSQSLVKSTGFKSATTIKEHKSDVKSLVSHADAILDDSIIVADYVSPLQSLIKPKAELTLESRSEMRDHASDLLGDDDSPAPSMNFIPMPDFSSMMPKQQPIVENKVIDPSLQLMTVPPPAIDPSIESQMRSLGLMM